MQQNKLKKNGKKFTKLQPKKPLTLKMQAKINYNKENSISNRKPNKSGKTLNKETIRIKAIHQKMIKDQAKIQIIIKVEGKIMIASNPIIQIKIIRVLISSHNKVEIEFNQVINQQMIMYDIINILLSNLLLKIKIIWKFIYPII